MQQGVVNLHKSVIFNNTHINNYNLTGNVMCGDGDDDETYTTLLSSSLLLSF